MGKGKGKGVLGRLSDELYFRRNLNKRLVKCKKSWDEISRIINKSCKKS